MENIKFNRSQGNSMDVKLEKLREEISYFTFNC